jgi:hypothetical protein
MLLLSFAGVQTASSSLDQFGRAPMCEEVRHARAVLWIRDRCKQQLR